MKKIHLHSQLFFSIFIFLFFIPTDFLNAQRLENEMLTIKEKYDLIGGTVLLFDKNKITKLVNFGNANLEKNIPINNETQFRVASISKTITAIAFMQLVEQKKIKLDEDISKLLGFRCLNPFQLEIAITPRMLLSHTSGLTDDPNSYDQFLTDTYENNPVPN